MDNERLDLIREQITPDLSSGNYFEAFQTFIEKSYEYMGIRPGVHPESLLFKWWFQMAIAMITGAVVVGILAYHSGGKMSVTSRAYLDPKTSRVVSARIII